MGLEGGGPRPGSQTGSAGTGPSGENTEDSRGGPSGGGKGGHAQCCRPRHLLCPSMGPIFTGAKAPRQVGVGGTEGKGQVWGFSVCRAAARIPAQTLPRTEQLCGQTVRAPLPGKDAPSLPTLPLLRKQGFRGPQWRCDPGLGAALRPPDSSAPAPATSMVWAIWTHSVMVMSLESKRGWHSSTV